MHVSGKQLTLRDAREWKATHFTLHAGAVPSALQPFPRISCVGRTSRRSGRRRTFGLERRRVTVPGQYHLAHSGLITVEGLDVCM
jgi:hypothetical protein